MSKWKLLPSVHDDIFDMLDNFTKICKDCPSTCHDNFEKKLVNEPSGTGYIIMKKQDQKVLAFFYST